MSCSPLALTYLHSGAHQTWGASAPLEWVNSELLRYRKLAQGLFFRTLIHHLTRVPPVSLRVERLVAFIVAPPVGGSSLWPFFFGYEEMGEVKHAMLLFVHTSKQGSGVFQTTSQTLAQFFVFCLHLTLFGPAGCCSAADSDSDSENKSCLYDTHAQFEGSGHFALCKCCHLSTRRTPRNHRRTSQHRPFRIVRHTSCPSPSRSWLKILMSYVCDLCAIVSFCLVPKYKRYGNVQERDRQQMLTPMQYLMWK